MRNRMENRHVFSASESSRAPANERGPSGRTSERVADASARATNAAADIAQDTARQGQENVRHGMRAFAELQSPLVHAGQDQSRQMLDTTSRMIDAYRKATESTAEDIQALVSSCSNLGRGIQQWHRTCFELMERSIAKASERRDAMVHCGSPVEFAELQQQMYRDAVSSMVEGSTQLLHLTGQIAQEAARPLQSRSNGSRA